MLGMLTVTVCNFWSLSDKIAKMTKEIYCNYSLCFNCFRKLEDGDIVNVDVTVCYKGCHGMLSPDEN